MPRRTTIYDGPQVPESAQAESLPDDPRPVVNGIPQGYWRHDPYFASSLHWTPERLIERGFAETCANPEFCRAYYGEPALCPYWEHYRDAGGWDVRGFDRDGYNDEGYDAYGCHRDTGRDRDGFDRRGFDVDGYTREGYDVYGYNRQGRDLYGFDRDGFDENGFDRDGYNRDGLNDDGDPRPEECDDDPWYDDDDDYRSSGLHDYSYTPHLVFRGDSGPYYGMEIEVTTDEVRRLVEIVDQEADGLVYCKHDGSVAGAELVTHPMSFEWAMRHFPWDMLRRLRNEAASTVIPQENGIHVHVGRDAFKDSAHLYRWMKLWYRNPQDIQRLARRQSSHWAAFNPDHRQGQKYHAKYGKPSYGIARSVPVASLPDRYRDRYARRTSVVLADENLDTTRYDRYAAINTTNEDTLEVRVFASTLRPARAKAALQLVAGTVEYTRQLTADAITHRHGWEFQAFMAWAGKQGIYPDLVSENARRR